MVSGHLGGASHRNNVANHGAGNKYLGILGPFSARRYLEAGLDGMNALRSECDWERPRETNPEIQFGTKPCYKF